jgi:transposase
MLNAEGDIVRQGRVRTNERAMRVEFSKLSPAQMAMEAGTHSGWVSRLLAGLGHEALVANPRQLPSIYQNHTKNDQVDAEQLARLARLDPKLLKPIRHRSGNTQTDRAMIQARDLLVRTRVKLIGHVRDMVKGTGERLEKCSTPCFYERAKGAIPDGLKPALFPILEVIRELNIRIGEYDARLEEMAAKKYPETNLLRQVKGVGALTALGYVLTIEDPRRFPKSRSVGSYLGLRPRQGDSGKSHPQLRITKAGDGYLRKLMVTSAHYIIGPFGPDTDLRRWGLALASRGGKNAKKRAVVAVARKLAVLLHRLWVTGEVYEPLRQAKRKEAAKREEGKKKGATKAA